MKNSLRIKSAWRALALGALSCVAGLPAVKAADPAVAAKDESAQELFDGAISLYANCKSYTAKVSSRQVFVSPALPLFGDSAMPAIVFRSAIYQDLSVRMRRDGSWLVTGDLISDQTPATSRATLHGAQRYVLSKVGGDRGNLALLRGMDPVAVSALAENDFSTELTSRLVGRGSFVLEPLLAPAGSYSPTSFPHENPQLEDVEDAQGHTLCRVRVHGENNATALLWIEKGTHQIWRTFFYSGNVVQQFTETLYFDQHFDEPLPDADFAMVTPTVLTPLAPAALGFADLYRTQQEMPDLLQPKTMAASPSLTAAPLPVAVGPTIDPTDQAMAGVVFVEGSEGVATGFIAKIHDIPFVVTNLHVFGDNGNISVKTIQGSSLAVSGIAAAIGADIAILRITDPASSPKPLELVPNVLTGAKINDDLTVIGNQLGGGVATKIKGQILGIGPSRIEVSAKFEPGNSGSPLIQTSTGKVLGVAAYSETVTIDFDGLRANNHGNVTRTVQRWFGFRLDSVARWETIDLARWQTQFERVTDFRLENFALLALIQGRFDDASKQLAVRSILKTFLDRKDKVDPMRPMAPEQAAALEYRDMLARAKSLAELDTQDFSSGIYYDYFRSSPYWTYNVADQTTFRQGLIKAFSELIALSRNDQINDASAMDSDNSSGTTGGRAIIRGQTSTNPGGGGSRQSGNSGSF